MKCSSNRLLVNTVYELHISLGTGKKILKNSAAILDEFWSLLISTATPPLSIFNLLNLSDFKEYGCWGFIA